MSTTVKKIGTFVQHPNDDGYVYVWLAYNDEPCVYNIAGDWFRARGVYVSAGMGALDAVSNVFVKSGGNLYCLEDEFHSTWEDLHSPSGGVQVDKSMGSYNISGLPYVFMTGTDGLLWVGWRSQSQGPWYWQERGKPDDAFISESMGAMRVNGYHNVFVKGSNNKLYVSVWSSTNDLNWHRLGKPISRNIDKSIGFCKIKDENNIDVPYIFMTCNDKHLWAAYPENAQEPYDYTWVDLGVPNPDGAGTAGHPVDIHQSMGVTCMGGNISVFVQDTAGTIWSCSGNAADGWTWQGLLAQPSPSLITMSIGTDLVNTIPQIWATSNDEIPNLWLATMVYGEWTWTNHGSPFNRILDPT